MTDIMNASGLNAASNAKDSVGLVDVLKDKLQIDAGKLQIDAEKLQINAEKLQIDAEKLQIDAEKLHNDAEKLHINAEKHQIDAEKLLIDAEKLQINAEKLQIDAEKDADVLETLSPIVRKRVEVLQEIQSQYDALEAKFFEERNALEDRYQKLYETLYTKRYEIVNGIVEVEGVIDESATNTSKEKGVPGFWLNAMNQNDLLVDEIQVRDELALKYLKDIKWSRIVEPKGFKLEFFFESNPFFKNTVLTKTYHMADEVDPILKKVIGTEIEWFPGRCLTQKTMMKKPKKGSNNTKPILKTAECDSFFNFFKPPEVLDDDADLDGDAAEQLQNLMEADYDIGSTIKDKLIPHAVSWFTGEAVELQNGKEEEYVVGVIEG